MATEGVLMIEHILICILGGAIGGFVAALIKDAINRVFWWNCMKYLKVVETHMRLCANVDNAIMFWLKKTIFLSMKKKYIYYVVVVNI